MHIKAQAPAVAAMMAGCPERTPINAPLTCRGREGGREGRKEGGFGESWRGVGVFEEDG